MTQTRTSLRQAGFTLIELSIVLVIIGLIVGGVLVGQDLIKAAEIRATVGQVEKYNAAINTFRTKYNAIPGDMLNTAASAFGIFQFTGTTAIGLGDGNGLIQDGTSADGTVVPFGESVIFWRHLSDAALVDGSYGASIAAATGQLGASPTPALYLPAAKMGRGNYWTVGSSAGVNYYILGGMSQITGGAVTAATYGSAVATAFTAQITPIEAYNIDIKLDDGAPNTGVVQARGRAASAFGALGAAGTGNTPSFHAAGAEASGDCNVGTGVANTDTYSRGTTAGNSPACILRMRFN